MKNSVSIFINSAAALLLTLATALLLINLTSPPDLVPPHDPVFLISLRNCFWLIDGTAFVLALVCFFSERPALPMFLLVWLATGFWACRMALFADGCHNLTGYLGAFSYEFGVSADTANVIANVCFAYLLVGVYGFLILKWLTRPKRNRLRQFAPASVELKVSCVNPSCRQRIVVDQSRFGREIQCPACGSILEVPIIITKS